MTTSLRGEWHRPPRLASLKLLLRRVIRRLRKASMKLRTSSTGSYPPVFDPESGISRLPAEEQDRLVQASIERAIRDQIQIGLDVLVDGQARDDIISTYTRRLPGYAGCSIPCPVIARVKPASEPLTLADYLFARSLCGDRQVKAHVTGPMTLARSSIVDPSSPYSSRNDPRLAMDLAEAIGCEARALARAGAQIIQIDEPVLADGVPLDAAISAINRVVEIGEISFPALHICGNVTGIFAEVLARASVSMISLESDWLLQPELRWVDRRYLEQHNKLIGLGCVRTNTFAIERITRLQNHLDQMVTRLGAENIWAVMPNCGLRYLPYESAFKKLEVMVMAAHTLNL
jgi:5-methyltetrahydropteroyltriglutamate--homocysteine methyltransferase